MISRLPSGRYRVRIYHRGLGKNVPICEVVGGLTRGQTFRTREEAAYQQHLAYLLTATQYGGRKTPRPAPPKVWSLPNKGEDDCRNCGDAATHLHHIVPRAFNSVGWEKMHENGMPLCSQCHRRWHSRVIEIPHRVMTDDELEFACQVAGEDWVERHYYDPRISVQDRLAGVQEAA